MAADWFTTALADVAANFKVLLDRFNKLQQSIRNRKEGDATGDDAGTVPFDVPVKAPGLQLGTGGGFTGIEPLPIEVAEFTTTEANPDLFIPAGSEDTRINLAIAADVFDEVGVYIVRAVGWSHLGISLGTRTLEIALAEGPDGLQDIGEPWHLRVHDDEGNQQPFYTEARYVVTAAPKSLYIDLVFIDSCQTFTDTYHVHGTIFIDYRGPAPA